MQKFLREYRYTLLLMAVTAIGITVTGVLFRQAAIRMIPLYVSLIISLMHTRAIRYAHLMGCINVIWYGFVNLYYGLIASAMFCFFFSCPVQLATFLNWQKHRYGASTTFKKLRTGWRFGIAVAFLAAWVCLAAVLRALGSAHQILDNTATLSGILVSLLVMLSFIEHAPLRVVDSLLNIALMLGVVLGGQPEQIPYVIYNTYALICVTIGAVRTLALYKEQQAALAKGEHDENSLGQKTECR